MRENSLKGRRIPLLIDFHTHLFPDRIAGKALRRLSDTCSLTPVTDGTVSGTLEKLDAWGVDKAVVMHIATNPAQQENVNTFAGQVNGRRLISFGSVHFESPQALDELRRISRMGLPGIKLHPDYQGFDCTDKRLYPIYDAVSQLGLLCCFHAGFDPYSPNHVHSAPAGFRQILRDFPRLRMICAHFGSMRMWDEVESELCGRRVYFDTSFSARSISPQQAQRIIGKHGAENIVFGSDCPWESARDTFRFIDSLDLSDAQKERIFYKNALDLLSCHETA